MIRCYMQTRGCFQSLGRTLLASALLHSVLQGKICLLFQVFLDYFCITVPDNEKDIFFLGVNARSSCSLHRTPQLHFFSTTGSGIDLDCHDIEWFALETNRDHSVVFEIASKSCILDSFVNYDGYSVSSKGFLPTVVDTMVISVKFTHSSPF